MTTLLVALLLSATGQKVGHSSTADVSHSKVTAAGAAQSRTLAEHLATLPDAQVTATGSTTARALKDIAADVPHAGGALINVKGPPYNAKGDGVADDSAAVAAAHATAKANKATLYFPAGTYRINQIVPGNYDRIVGDGWQRTFLRPLDVNQSVILIDRQSGNGYSVEIAHLNLRGYSSGTGHGIESTALSDGAAGLRIHDVRISEVGGDGVHLAKAWNSTLRNVMSTGNLGHQFFVDVAINTVLFDTTYAGAVPTAGMAGYRVMEGRATFLNANGINAGDSGAGGQYWGIFGGSAADGDPRDANATIHMVGCNVEDAKERGVWIKRNTRFQIDSTSFGGPDATLAPTGSIGLYIHNFNQNAVGMLGSNVTFTLKAGGSWRNTFPIHSWTPPGVIRYGIVDAATVWAEQAGYSVGIPAMYAQDGDGYLKVAPGLVVGSAASAPRVISGAGAPSGDAVIGSLYLRTDGGATTSLYVKTAAGAGAANWTAK
jgi:hypothetical protein